MRYLLDTNICVAAIRGQSAGLVAKLRRHKLGSVGISSITLAELQYGVARSSNPERNLIALAEFVAPLDVAAFDGRAAAAYGPLRALLAKKGTPIGPLDTLIAAHAVALGLTLVTSNEREFVRVTGLHSENWLDG